ncbi:hypothetical protein [Paraflavitalea speifideaquila]|uniref:hypothetical protein n=1 Tax=Paraflavitalea speifideaquila TaxID=3076558 RepID=UPI0028ECBADF|nr:hypothetical protein [Paraflavitalea speifideiaquila]
MVNCLLKDGNTLYVGGYFPFINGFTRRSLAAFNLSTGALTSWAPGTNNFVWSMAKQGNTIYIGGNFTTVGTVSRNHLAAVYTNGNVASWNPNAGYTGTLQPTTWAVGANASYVFAGGTLSSFGDTYRPFYATLGPAWLMPLTWQQVSATMHNNQVLVKWGTEQEQGTRDFIIQHSTDGSQWNNIGTTTAAGNSNSPQQYSYLHGQPAASINYYRILQRDLDGRSTQSKVVSVRTGKQAKRGNY